MGIMNKYFSLLLCILIFIVYAVWLVTHTDVNFTKIASTGTFGDSFGWLTCLISALAFWGVYRTMQMQKAEMERLKKEVDERSIREQLQAFESTFFQLINTLQNIIADMRFYDSEMVKDFEGRIVFAKYYEKLHREICSHETSCLLQSNADDFIRAKRILKRQSTSFFGKRTQYFGHYFRFLINLIKFVDDSSIDSGNKKRYINIIKSQLSTYEMVIMFYYAQSNYGEELKIIIEKFALFEHFPLDKLFSRKQVMLFSDTAWKL